jgi:magnesium chelatase family protein
MCRCTTGRVRAYQGRVSGPLLDRIDLHAEVPAVPYADLAGPPGEPSSAVAERVAAARSRQAARAHVSGARTNADLAGGGLREAARLDSEGTRLLATAMERLRLTGRAHDRLLRVARTLADLDQVEHVAPRHVAEALHYRRCTADTATTENESALRLIGESG